MDVRCEKCQTEYELDEARLKPAGVTVKCTNCGHMFKIRKRATTNVGAPPASAVEATTRQRPSSSKQNRVDAAIGDDTVRTQAAEADSGPTAVDRERNWLLRLENGEKKECRELATLQQWIVAGTVTRESLISRSGKTWKRLGDIGELAQYFTVADEARARRSQQTTIDPPTKQIDLRSTMMGVGTVKSSAAGGTILPDDDDVRSTGNFRAPPASMPPPPGAAAKTPPMGVRPPTKAPPIPAQKKPPSANETLKPASINQTLAAAMPPAPPQPQPQMLATAATMAPDASMQRPTPPVAPPAPTNKPVAYAETMPSTSPELARATAGARTTPPPPPAPAAPKLPPDAGNSMGGLPRLDGHAPSGSRATAAWASEAIKADDSPNRGPSGPIGGRLGAIPNEPAFAGRVRAEPTDSSVFAGKVQSVLDDDDDVLPQRRGSKAGLIIALGSLLVIGGAVAVVYLYVLKNPSPDTKQAGGSGSAGSGSAGSAVAVASLDAGPPVVTPLTDAAPAPTDPLSAARGELSADVEGRLKAALDGLAAGTTKDEPATQAIRARLDAALAQDHADRANLTADRAEADKLRQKSHQLVIDALPLAQHGLKDATNADANLAMADVLRLQGRSAAEIKRYTDKARTTAARDAELEDALVLARDGKLEDARAAFAAIDGGDGKLETTGDVRARFHLALALLAQDKGADAKPLVDQVLAAQPEHVAARALSAKLETTVARTDPMPNEDHRDAGVGVAPVVDAGAGVVTPPNGGGGEAGYDALMAEAKKVADTNCSKAMDLYQKALDIKPSSVEALTGQGYCHLDAKQFSQAYAKFHAALLYSSKYEPALAGIAEMYQQQGNKDKAIESWRAYLAAYPGSPKATRNLELLGAGAEQPQQPQQPQQPGSDAPPATPPPTPPPAPPTDPGSNS